MTGEAIAQGDVRTVYLHIGAFKTGTTYLQEVMRSSHEALREQGMFFPGGSRWCRQVAGARDLVGLYKRGEDAADVPGGWNALAEEIKAWDGPSALVSMEFLSMASPRQARRAVRALQPAQVHVVLTARDLAGVVAGMWQETLKVGGTCTWDDYIASLRDPDRAAIPPALGFWICQDLPAILDVWEQAVGRERIHIVTVPPPGAPKQVLLERFCDAVGLDVDRLTVLAPRSNQSLGAAEGEALRRLNANLGKRADLAEYRRVIKQVVARHLSDTTQKSSQVRLPPEDRLWAEKKAREITDVLAQRGYHVVGDLNDLIPETTHLSPGFVPRDVSDGEVLDASTRAATALTERLAQRKLPKELQTPQPDVGWRQKLASDARGETYRAKRYVADLSRHNRATAWAVTTYRNISLERRRSRP
jgi:hypothetical protein